jgi:hypothetical protein
MAGSSFVLKDKDKASPFIRVSELNLRPLHFWILVGVRRRHIIILSGVPAAFIRELFREFGMES